MPTLTTLSEPARDIRDSRHLLKLGSTANGHALENLCIGLARLTESLVAPLYALCANSGCEQVQRSAPYSITSSARAITEAGTVMPSACAVLRLILRWKRVGCSNGSSAGLAPLKRRSIR